MRDLIVQIFGIYQPVMTSTLIEDSTGALVEIEVVASGMAGVDWPYVLGVFAYLIVLYSFLRMVGMLLGGAR